MTKVAFFGKSEHALETVFTPEQRKRLAPLCQVHPEAVSDLNLKKQLPSLKDLEVIFSTWGMLALTPEQLAMLPELKAVFYAAGSVKGFAAPLLERNITVVSAWAANAIPVAEFTLAQILLANKGYFRNARACAAPSTRSKAFKGTGNFDETVALLGAGMIGRKVIELLKPFKLRVIVFDPFLSIDEARRLGVEKVTLDQAFQRGLVVSNHLANVPETQNMLKREHFQAMQQDATFINTGRGATVAESEMIEVLRRRTDITALLDVTHPEPPATDSPLYSMPNVILSGHIAGSIGREVVRMADTVIDEFFAWREGKPLRYSVTLEMLKTMA